MKAGVVERMRQLGPSKLVEPAFNQFCSPSVEEAIDRLVERGAELWLSRRP